MGVPSGTGNGKNQGEISFFQQLLKPDKSIYLFSAITSFLLQNDISIFPFKKGKTFSNTHKVSNIQGVERIKKSGQRLRFHNLNFQIGCRY